MTLRTRACWLWILLGLFALRVLGQLLVALSRAPFLPPMEEWYSGLIPYPQLLLSQFLTILLYGKVCVDFSRGQGFFVTSRKWLGSGLLGFGVLYLGVMVIRYILRMSLYPSERWVGGSIPIFFHWVLASFLLIVGTYHAALTRKADPGGMKRWPIRMGRLFGVLAVSGSVLAWLGWQLAPSGLAYVLRARAPEFPVRIERGATLSTLDGVKMVAEIYHPQRLKKTPTILVRIPLVRDLMVRLFSDVVGRFWAERGYTVIFQATRGHHPSGGTYVPFRYERNDGIETLNWVARQPWWNGRLGMWGGSYFGYTQWVLADQVDPGPSALLVQICSTDWYRMFYPGGAFSLANALYWAVWSGTGRDKPPSSEVLQPGYEGLPLIEADNRTGQDIDFFNQWVTHTERDSYWADVDGSNRPESLVAPVLLMAGWYDPFLPGMLDDFVRIREGARPNVVRNTRLIIGPWRHARSLILPGGPKLRNYRLDSIEPSLAWFDQYLKNGILDTVAAPVRIFVMGRNVWRDEHEWPPARAQQRAYYLRSAGQASSVTGDGQLSIKLPIEEESPDTYVYDPVNPVPTAGGALFGPRGGISLQNAIEARPDVLVYSTPVLNKDIEVTGPIKLVLYVSTTAPSTDFTGKLIDVHPDGSAYNVSEGILRRSYQGTDQPTEIEIDLWPTSMVFLKGHRIRLEVSSSNYPRFDRNPNTGRSIGMETEMMRATQTLFHDQQNPSRVILPVIESESSDVRIE